MILVVGLLVWVRIGGAERRQFDQWVVVCWMLFAFSVRHSLCSFLSVLCLCLMLDKYIVINTVIRGFKIIWAFEKRCNYCGAWLLGGFYYLKAYQSFDPKFTKGQLLKKYKLPRIFSPRNALPNS